MEVVFLKSFLKDIEKIKDASIKFKLKQLILSVEAAASLQDIKQLRKLKGYAIAYRIRLGDYRVGIFYENDEVQFVRLVKRNDIYKLFP